MSVHSYRDGGNIVFWDGHRHRIVEVIGPGVMYRLPTFGQLVMPNTVDPDGCTTTVVEAGAGTSEIDPGVADGVIATVVTAANENDGAQTQLPGAMITCISGHKFYLGMNFQINDATQSDIIFGACITDTTLLGGMTDGVYMEKLDAATSVSVVSEKDSSEEQTDSMGTLADDTDQYWEMFWDGTRVNYYINGVSVATHSTTIPDNEGLRVSLAVLTGEAVAQTLKIKRLAAFAWT